MTHVATYSAHRTAESTLGDHRPKPTAMADGLTEAARTIWSGSGIETGLWECTPGAFTAERIGYTEICTILSGRVTLFVEGYEPVEYGPGDVIVMPSGWTGVWDVHEPLRKHYTTVQD